MNKDIDKKTLIKKIRNKLVEASSFYYNTDKTKMTDFEFDILKDKLQRLSPDDPFLSTVGAPLKPSEWKKVAHKIPMKSLNKVNTEEEFLKWIKDTNEKEFSIEDKLDGLSIDLEYEDGQLIHAITLGDDGMHGDDILVNVSKMKNVKTQILGFTGSFRGEIIILLDDFEKVNEIYLRNEGRTLKNPRNSVSGIAKRYDGKCSEYLSVKYFDVVKEDYKFTEETKKKEFINLLDLKTCFYKKVNVEQAIKIYYEYEEKLRAGTPYDIDGLVIKCNSIELQDDLGLVNKRPRGQIAWKFTSIKKETELLGIKWSIRNKRITPIALLKSVNMGGVKIRKASMHNIEIFKKFNVGIGDEVLVSRRNDVIPQIEHVIKYKGEKFKIPTQCPVCEMDLKEDGKFLICANSECTASTLGSLNKWIYSLKIMDIGVKTIESLHEEGLIHEPADFYKLKNKNIARLEGLGERSAKKIIDNLNAKKELTLPEFIGALNIDNFARATTEKLVEAGLDTLDKIQSIDFDRRHELTAINGIEEKTAEKIITGLEKKKNIIKNLLDIGITFKEIEKLEVESVTLDGKSFCFTGAIERTDDEGNRYTRKMMEELVLKNGGTISSVKTGLDHLVMADPNSIKSKAVKARKLNIKLLGEKTFFEMLGM